MSATMPLRACAATATMAAAIVLAGCQEGGVIARQQVAGGDPVRGERAIVQYGCGSCHVVPGVAAAEGRVGPPLTDFADRTYVAGRVRNEPAALVQWISNPQSIDSATAMPNLGVPEQDARDIAAYLYTLGSPRLGPPHPIPAKSLPGH